jgi:sensor domain CHASE-containing protein
MLLAGIAGSFKVAMIERDNRLNDARGMATHDLATVRARVEGVVHSVFSATSGLVSVIAYQGNIDSNLFDSLAERAIQIHPQIRSIGMAPGNTVARVYPLAGNRGVLGVRYDRVPDQYRTVLRAMQTGEPILGVCRA